MPIINYFFFNTVLSISHILFYVRLLSFNEKCLSASRLQVDRIMKTEDRFRSCLLPCEVEISRLTLYMIYFSNTIPKHTSKSWRQIIMGNNFQRFCFILQFLNNLTSFFSWNRRKASFTRRDTHNSPAGLWRPLQTPSGGPLRQGLGVDTGFGPLCRHRARRQRFLLGRYHRPTYKKDNSPWDLHYQN